ncbi:hypothetical protein COOONC_13255 [Cooperia oncophora]
MGVHNLLPFVKNACRQGNVTEFSGYSVAMDVSCLLCKSLFGYVGSKAQGLKANLSGITCSITARTKNWHNGFINIVSPESWHCTQFGRLLL